MQPILFSVLLSLVLATAQAQPDAARLIVRGDDMGYAHSGNEALIHCYQEGILTSIEVIVPSPWFPEAVKLLHENPGVSHVSAHMGCTSLTEEVEALTESLGKEYHLLVNPEVTYLQGDGGNQKTSAERIQRFLTMLDSLKAGKTYLFVEHPGFDNEELQAIYHIGYENVAEDRQGVTDLFTSDEVKAFIQQKGIQLVSYQALVAP